MKSKTVWMFFVLAITLAAASLANAETLESRIDDAFWSCFGWPTDWSYSEYGECKGKSYKPMFSDSSLDDGLNKFVWIPSKGTLKVFDDFIAIQIQFDDEAIDFFRANFADTPNRMPMAFEIDIADISGTMNELGDFYVAEGNHSSPANLHIFKDTDLLDDGHPYSLIVMSPQNFKAGEIYTFLYRSKSSIPNAETIRLIFQISMNTELADEIIKAHDSGKSTSDIPDSIGSVYDYFVVKSNGFNTIKYPELDAICWHSKSGDDPGCESGYPFAAGPDPESVSTRTIPTDNSDPPTEFSPVTGIVQPPAPNPSGPYPNLRIWSIGIFSDGHELDEQSSFLKVDTTCEIRVYPVAEEEDCEKGTDQDIQNVETDIYYKISREDSDGEWRFLRRVYTRPSTLTEDNPHRETAYFTVPPEAKNRRVYFRAKVDSTKEIHETNEDDNWSYWQKEWYPVSGDVDLVVAVAQLVGQKTSVNLGSTYRLEMAVENVGLDAPMIGFRSAYYLQKPGATAFTRVADDGSNSDELVPPGRWQWEATPTEGYVADKIGTHNVTICADYQASVPELDESNNCSSFSFEVLPVGPDFVVADQYIKVGSTTYRAGSTIKKSSYVHPYCVVKNIGNSGTHPGFRLAYYINANKYRDSDGVDPNQVGVGVSHTEYVSSDSIRLGDTGTRTYRCCADYQGAVPELNETNNCSTMTFYVR